MMGSGKIYALAILAIYIFIMIGPIKCAESDHVFVKYFQTEYAITTATAPIKEDEYFATTTASDRKTMCKEAWYFVKLKNKMSQTKMRTPSFILSAHNFNIANSTDLVPGILCATNPLLVVATEDDNTWMTAYLQ